MAYIILVNFESKRDYGVMEEHPEFHGKMIVRPAVPHYHGKAIFW
jgi:hypothetical protein